MLKVSMGFFLGCKMMMILPPFISILSLAQNYNNVLSIFTRLSLNCLSSHFYVFWNTLIYMLYCVLSILRNLCVKLFLWNLWYSIFLNSNRCEQFFFNQLFCITRPRSDSQNSITHIFIRYSFSHTLHTLCQADRRGAYKIVVFI